MVGKGNALSHHCLEWLVLYSSADVEAAHDEIPLTTETRAPTAGSSSNWGATCSPAPDRGLDLGCMASLVRQIAQIRRRRALQVVLVSSGAMASGREILGRVPDHRGVPLKQVLASVGQGRLMQAYDRLFGEHGITVAQALLSPGETSPTGSATSMFGTPLTPCWSSVSSPLLTRTTSWQWKRSRGAQFGDNDNLSAMVANLVDADLLMILSDVAGLYTADPMQDPNAKSDTQGRFHRRLHNLPRCTGPRAPKAVGGMVTKLQAAGLGHGFRA